MGTGNDVRRHEAITDPFTGVGTSAHGGIHSAGLTSNHHRDVTTTDILTTNQRDLSCLGHGIGSLDGRNHATGFNHAEGHTGDP